MTSQATNCAQVAQLSGYVSEHAAYHHGEASLQSTIVGMAQSFVGSNNINLLAPKGQFGTRLQVRPHKPQASAGSNPASCSAPFVVYQLKRHKGGGTMSACGLAVAVQCMQQHLREPRLWSNTDACTRPSLKQAPLCSPDTISAEPAACREARMPPALDTSTPCWRRARGPCSTRRTTSC